MMRLIEVLHNPHDKYQSVYRCDVCHGVAIDKGFKSEEEATSAKRMAAMSHCRLCDDSALLSKRYSMALDTLAWAVKSWGRSYQGEEIGFPSIDTVSTWGKNIRNIEVDFYRISQGLCHRKRQEFTASREGYSFDDVWEIGAEPDESTYWEMKQFIREKVVSLVIHDLAAQNKKTEDGGNHE